MSTTYSPALLLALQGFNDNSNTWGSVLNNQFLILDSAIAGVAPINVTGSVTVNLTTSVTDGLQSQSNSAVLKFTGIPTANATIVTPNTTKIYAYHSSLTAAHNVLLHATGSAVIVTVLPSDSGFLYCDGTDLIKIVDSNIGALVASNNLSDLTNTSAAIVNLGINATQANLNELVGLTTSAGVLNQLAGMTVSAAQLNYLSGATSNIQTQLTNLTSVINVVSVAVVAAVSVVASVAGRIVNGPVTTQYGYSSASAASPSIVFGVAFSGAPYSLSFAGKGDGAGVWYTSVSAGGFNTFTGATDQQGGAFHYSFYWIAIGPT